MNEDISHSSHGRGEMGVELKAKGKVNDRRLLVVWKILCFRLDSCY